MGARDALRGTVDEDKLKLSNDSRELMRSLCVLILLRGLIFALVDDGPFLVWRAPLFPDFDVCDIESSLSRTFLHGNKKRIHNSRASLGSTQKKMNIRNPWKELHMANRYWKVVEAPEIVKAPNIHVSPNRVMIPKMLIMSLFVCFCELLVLALTEVKEC